MYFSGKFTAKSVFLTAIAVFLRNLPGKFGATDQQRSRAAEQQKGAAARHEKRAMSVQLEVPESAKRAEKCRNVHFFFHQEHAAPSEPEQQFKDTARQQHASTSSRQTIRAAAQENTLDITPSFVIQCITKGGM